MSPLNITRAAILVAAYLAALVVADAQAFAAFSAGIGLAILTLTPPWDHA